MQLVAFSLITNPLSFAFQYIYVFILDGDKTELNPLNAWKWVRSEVGTNPRVGIVPGGTNTLADLFRRNESAAKVGNKSAVTVVQ